MDDQRMRSELIHIASSLPKNNEVRREILAILSKRGKGTTEKILGNAQVHLGDSIRATGAIMGALEYRLLDPQGRTDYETGEPYLTDRQKKVVESWAHEIQEALLAMGRAAEYLQRGKRKARYVDGFLGQ